MERKRLNSAANASNGTSTLNLGPASPDITRMLTPTLSDDKTDALSTEISLDFSKFETDTMLNSSYNPDRDIDRSPDPTCLQLQSPSPLDLSITTSFENSLSDCGVTCFDSGKNTYSFSNSVNSTESDSFSHIDEALAIDSFTKSHVDSSLTKIVPVSTIISSPPIILGSIGAANFVTAVLNKNIHNQQIMNNMVIPSTSMSVNSPGIFVLNPCTLTSGIVNVKPSVRLANTSTSTPPTSMIHMYPPPIKSIISLLTSKPQTISSKDEFNTSLMMTEESVNSEKGTCQVHDIDANIVSHNSHMHPGSDVEIIPIFTSNKNSGIVREHDQSEHDCHNKTSEIETPKTIIIDIQDIRDEDGNNNSDDDCTLLLTAENMSDEVDGVVENLHNDNTDNTLITSSKYTSTEYKEKQDTNTPMSQDNGQKQLLAIDSRASELLGKKRRCYNRRQTKTKMVPMILKCDLCSATFSKQGNYNRHRKIHNICSEAEDPRYSCTHCDRKFIQKCDMKRHMLIHMKQEPYRCETCNKGYVRKSDLTVHMRFHTGERSHACDSCDKKFFQIGDLNRHKRQVHNNTPGLTCGHCQRSYAKETTLIRHMQSSHRELILRSLNEKLQSPTVSIQTSDCVEENDEETP